MTFSHLKREHAEHVLKVWYLGIEKYWILETHHMIRPDHFVSIHNACWKCCIIFVHCEIHNHIIWAWWNISQIMMKMYVSRRFLTCLNLWLLGSRADAHASKINIFNTFLTIQVSVKFNRYHFRFCKEDTITFKIQKSN